MRMQARLLLSQESFSLEKKPMICLCGAEEVLLWWGELAGGV